MPLLVGVMLIVREVREEAVFDAEECELLLAAVVPETLALRDADGLAETLRESTGVAVARIEPEGEREMTAVALFDRDAMGVCV